MGSSVLYTLKKGVPLLTDFSVDPLQAPYMTTFEIYSTYMANAVEQIMPESGILKQFWLPIKAIFMQLTCKIIDLWYIVLHLLDHTNEDISQAGRVVHPDQLIYDTKGSFLVMLEYAAEYICHPHQF